MNHKEPTKWERRFLDMARLLSTWSKDPSTQVGAVITDTRNRVISVGFNGLPHGVSDDPAILDDRELKYQCILHAEENAIFFASRPLDGTTMYIYPAPPCGPCAARIRQAGIARVVCPAEMTTGFTDRWAASLAVAKLILDGAVRLDMVNFPGYSLDNGRQKPPTTRPA